MTQTPHDEIRRVNIKEIISVGCKVKLEYAPNDFRNRILHIRAIVDGNWVVYRRWQRTGGGSWVYRLRPMGWFDNLLKKGLLKLPAGHKWHKSLPKKKQL